MASKQKPLPKVERVNDREERKKALETALKAIEKACGKGAVMRMADDAAEKDIETVSTGSLSLDLALGVGGLPRGRIIEVYGPESSGKTTLALHVVSEMQKIGGTCAYVDAEHALDPLYAAKLGVKMPELLLSQPNSGEEALEITDALVRSGAVDLVVVDSVAALVPRSEIEGEMGDALPGLQARLMSQALRKITSSVQKTKSMVIFINQIRYKIGVMRGSPETTAGGNALKFYATVRLDIRRREAIKKNDEVLGNETTVKVVKNKVAPPFKLAHFDIMYGEGISHYGELIDMAEENGILEKSGSWYAYQGKKIGQGKEKVRDKLKEDPELAAEIEQKIRTMKGIRVQSCKTADEEYAEEQAAIAAAQRRPPVPEIRPSEESNGVQAPGIDWHDIQVGTDSMSKEEVEEALGY